MLSLIIPAYNEQSIIKKTVNYADDFLEKHCGNYEIIVVDDGSRDDTSKVLAGTNTTVVTMPRNRGKAAVREGISKSNGDYIFTDADLPYSLEFVVNGAKMLSKFDMVCGKRCGNYPLKRRLASAVYNKFTQSILKTDTEDVQCGIKGFTKKAAVRLLSLCRVDGFAFDTELIFLARMMGLEIGFIDVASTADSR